MCCGMCNKPEKCEKCEKLKLRLDLAAQVIDQLERQIAELRAAYESEHG